MLGEGGGVDQFVRNKRCGRWGGVDLFVRNKRCGCEAPGGPREEGGALLGGEIHQHALGQEERRRAEVDPRRAQRRLQLCVRARRSRRRAVRLARRGAPHPEPRPRVQQAPQPPPLPVLNGHAAAPPY